MFPVSISGSYSAALPFTNRLRGLNWPVSDLDRGADPSATELLLFMPRDILESERLLFEQEAWAKTLPALKVIVIAATLSPRYVRALRNRIAARITLIDAPVIGAARLADGGSGAFLLGGPQAELARLQPLFQTLGHRATRMGEFGTAMAAKALQDCLAAATSALTRSALDWAEAQGIEENNLLPFLEATFGAGLPDPVADPAALVPNALPGDNAGEQLVRQVESALDSALKGVHLTPPRNLHAGHAALRARHIH